MERNMQAITAAAPQTLLSQLDFSLPSSAEYVKTRQQVTFNPSGGSTYGPGQSSIIRFHIAEADGFLDPSSLRIQFRVNNTDSTAANLLQPVSDIPSCCFSRLTVKAGGQTVEDINSFNSVSHMVQRTMNQHIVSDMEAEGFDGATIAGGGNEFRLVSFKPLSGLLQQSKYLPLRFISGLTLELTVAPAGEWLKSTAAVTSQAFTITQPELKCDLVHIAGDLAEQYASYLLNSAPLPIVYSQYYVTTQAISAADTEFTINLARSCSKLQSIFFFMNNTTADVAYAALKKTNNLKSPGDEGFSFKIQVGSKRFPLQDCTGYSEARAKLSQAVGVHASSCHSLAIPQGAYRAHTWIGAVDTELAAQGAHLTGTDTRAGDLVTVQLKGMAAAAAAPATGSTSVTVVLLAQTIMNVRDSGVDILD